MQFYAAWDDISTTKAWSRPNLHQLILWWNDIQKLHNLDDYEVYLVGGFAEYLHNPTLPMTWDMDICLVSDNPNYNELKSILDDSLKLALHHNFLIDIKGVPTYTWSFFQKLHSGEIPPKEKIDKEQFYLLKNYKKFVKYIDGELDREFSLNEDNYKNWSEVTDGLYKDFNHYSLLYNKVIDRFNDGTYVGKIVDLKTTDFNFVT